MTLPVAILSSRLGPMDSMAVGRGPPKPHGGRKIQLEGLLAQIAQKTVLHQVIHESWPFGKPVKFIPIKKHPILMNHGSGFERRSGDCLQLPAVGKLWYHLSIRIRSIFLKWWRMPFPYAIDCILVVLKRWCLLKQIVLTIQSLAERKVWV